MNRPVHKFGPNRHGRDFVVGDLHGEFARLQAQLEQLGFDAATDRLFSVGDLIDRGPASPAALDWLAHPWFHAVLGNHESMLIDATVNDSQLRWWLLNNGGEWWLAQDEDTRERFLTALRELPLACEVETANDRRIGIVHADMPVGLDWDAFTQRLENDPELQYETLWSRKRIHDNEDTPVPGIDAVYCGHTPLATPLVMGNVHFIDTGACFGGPLTMIRIDAGPSSGA